MLIVPGDVAIITWVLPKRQNCGVSASKYCIELPAYGSPSSQTIDCLRLFSIVGWQVLTLAKHCNRPLIVHFLDDIDRYATEVAHEGA